MKKIVLNPFYIIKIVYYNMSDEQLLNTTFTNTHASCIDQSEKIVHEYPSYSVVVYSNPYIRRQYITDSPFAKRSVLTDFYQVNPLGNREVVDFSFLEAYPYWLDAFEYLYNSLTDTFDKPCSQVILHMLYSAHLNNTLAALRWGDILSAPRQVAEMYMVMVRENLELLDFSFLLLPEFGEWAAIWEELSTLSFGPLYMTIIHKAFSIGVLSFMAAEGILAGTLETEYKRALFEHLPAIVNLPCVWVMHHIINPHELSVVKMPQCDDRCKRRLARSRNFAYCDEDLDTLSVETSEEYYMVCRHCTH